MKKKLKKLIPLAVIAIIVAVAAVYMVNASKVVHPTMVRTTVLDKGDLVYAVSTTGTVFSKEAVNVYSTLSYPVQDVFVQVGDRVEEGQLLAQLDTTDLQASIRKTRAALSVSQEAAYQKLEVAQRELKTYDTRKEEQNNSTILDAENAVTEAELRRQTANRALRSARLDYQDKKDENYEDGVLREFKDLVAAREQDVELANLALENAKKALELAQMGTEDTRVSYEDNIKGLELAANFDAELIELQTMERNLQDAAITAPTQGIVTAVMAQEGNSGAGLLFVIQNPDELKVLTNVKEYDIQRVQPGNLVEIKTDATGDAVFEGSLERIAPTSTLTTTAEEKISTESEFETEVAVAPGSDLKIGMNARLSIVTEKRNNVFYIPFEAIQDDWETGETFLYVMRPQPGGVFTAERIAVTIGMETDFYSEISAPQLQAGDFVILEAAKVTDGMLVTATPGYPSPEALPAQEEQPGQTEEAAAQPGEEADGNE